MNSSLLSLFPGVKQFKQGKKILAIVYFSLTTLGYIFGFFPGLFIHILYLILTYRNSFKTLLSIEEKSQSIKNLEQEIRTQEELLQQSRINLESITRKLSLSQDIESLILEKERQETGLKNIATEKYQKLETLRLIDNIIALKAKLDELSLEKREIQESITRLKDEVKALEEEQVLQSYGFYEFKYSFPDSQGYQDQLDVIKAK